MSAHSPVRLQAWAERKFPGLCVAGGTVHALQTQFDYLIIALLILSIWGRGGMERGVTADSGVAEPKGMGRLVREQSCSLNVLHYRVTLIT